MQLDAISGKLKPIERQRDEAWIAGPGIGGGNFGTKIGWINNNQFYFQSETSGYAHVHVFDVNTRSIKDITPGKYEVQDLILSKNKQFLGKEIGEYKLKVTNSRGCKKEFPFTIKDKNIMAKDHWVLYPDPIASGETFYVTFNYQKATKVTVSIFDLNDKLLHYKDLGVITSFEYENTLVVSGTYMIVCSINGVSQTSKLIVK